MLKVLTSKLSSNASTVIVFVAAFGYLAYLNAVNPDKAGDQLLPVLGAAGAVARLLYQVDEAKAKAALAAAVATEAVQVGEQSLSASRNNAASLRSVKVDVQEAKVGIDTVHGAVNHQQDLLRAEIAELRETLTAERHERGSEHPSPTPVTDAIKLEDAARAPTIP